MKERKECWHWFHGLYGITQKEKEHLLELCPDVEEWYQRGTEKRTSDILETVCLETEKQKTRREVIGKILESEIQREKLNHSYEVLKLKQINLCSREEAEYPKRLRTMEYPPFVLYYKGKLPKEEMPSLAVIGARNCSVYGEEIAASFAERFSDAGIQIISGMARGIDAAAQRTAIKSDGKSYAVLGSGVDVCYPKENVQLYEALCEMGGVISEELPGTQPVSRNFPKRNRLISGLADAVFVVEAREKSGSLITVSHALEQGKDIYAVPGRIYERLAEGTNRLIQEGACLVREPEDILMDFKDKIGKKVGSHMKKTPEIQKKPNLLLETEEKIVYACLSLHPKHVEQICSETGFSVSELTSLLFQMELKHYIKQPVKNYYMIQN